MGYVPDKALWGAYGFCARLLDIGFLMRLFLLACCLSVVWYSVMLLMSWYSAGFHLAATFSSTLMAATGNSWGVMGVLVGQDT